MHSQGGQDAGSRDGRYMAGRATFRHVVNRCVLAVTLLLAFTACRRRDAPDAGLPAPVTPRPTPPGVIPASVPDVLSMDAGVIPAATRDAGSIDAGDATPVTDDALAMRPHVTLEIEGPAAEGDTHQGWDLRLLIPNALGALTEVYGTHISESIESPDHDPCIPDPGFVPAVTISCWYGGGSQELNVSLHGRTVGWRLVNHDDSESPTPPEHGHATLPLDAQHNAIEIIVVHDDRDGGVPEDSTVTDGRSSQTPDSIGHRG